MRKEFFLSLVGLTVCLTGIITVSSCSKDEFFGIEDVSCIDSQRMHEIAESDLYIDYQKACFSMVDELSKIDSTKRGRVVITDGDTLYENVHFISFENVNILFDSLVQTYPELKNADQADLKDIQAIALSQNSVLRKMYPLNGRNYQKRTRGGIDNYGYMNQAIEWIHSLPGIRNRDHGSTYTDAGPYTIGESIYYLTFEIIPCVTVGDAMNLAIIWSNNHEGVEVGGYGWSDSGVMIYNEQATPEYEGMIYASSGNPQPLMDFHIHPNGWLYPSDNDLEWWSGSPEVTIHYIISPNYEFSVW